ncbi:MAG TPA: serine hydrolase domain-containing protein [Vicinamibacteria bacterium]|jgi:CubicO group peptidase (beta-lactamase class C family)
MTIATAGSMLTTVLLLQPGAPPAAPDLAAKIDAYMQPFLEGQNFTGAVLVSRGNKVLFSKAYGMANWELGVANTPRSRFHLASLTKMFTAAAILLLEERGKLSTSDPVSRFLPDYPNGNRIRLEHLLTHTAGVPNAKFSRGEDRMSYSTAELVAKFKDAPLEFEPGARTRYSNANYNLLAHIVETVSGQKYGAFLKANVFDPLGMTSTVNDDDPATLIPDRAYGTVPAGLADMANAPYVDWSTKTGSGSLVSTTEDVARFVHAELEGALLRPASLAKIREEHPGFPYGWSHSERFGRKQLAVGGRSPGFISDVEYYLDDKTVVVVLTNSYASMGQDPVVGDIGAILYGQPIERGRIAFVKPKPGALAAFVGRYKMPADYFAPDTTLTLKDLGDYLEARWERGEISVVYPVGPDEFMDRNIWARVRFQRDAAGRVTGFVYHVLRDFTATRLPE